MKPTRTALLCSLLLACAANPKHGVIIDRAGVDMDAYYRDLDECAEYAGEVQTADTTARRAGRGAAVGGAVGGILDGTEGAGTGAGIGAVTGAARGYTLSEEEQQRVVRRCLRGRGYKVLN